MKNADKNKASIRVANLEPNIGNELAGKNEIKKVDTPCRIHIHSRRHQLTDADGISAKAVIDGLVHAGLLPDDSAKEISDLTFSQRKIHKKEIEETTITIF